MKVAAGQRWKKLDHEHKRMFAERAHLRGLVARGADGCFVGGAIPAPGIAASSTDHAISAGAVAETDDSFLQTPKKKKGMKTRLSIPMQRSHKQLVMPCPPMTRRRKSGGCCARFWRQSCMRMASHSGSFAKLLALGSCTSSILAQLLPLRAGLRARSQYPMQSWSGCCSLCLQIARSCIPHWRSRSGHCQLRSAAVLAKYKS